MEKIIKEMIAQANNERNFDLIRLIKEILNEFAYTYNCPSNWRYIGAELAREYSEDSWIYEHLELDNFID